MAEDISDIEPGEGSGSATAVAQAVTRGSGDGLPAQIQAAIAHPGAAENGCREEWCIRIFPARIETAWQAFAPIIERRHAIVKGASPGRVGVLEVGSRYFKSGLLLRAIKILLGAAVNRIAARSRHRVPGQHGAAGFRGHAEIFDERGCGSGGIEVRIDHIEVDGTRRERDLGLAVEGRREFFDHDIVAVPVIGPRVSGQAIECGGAGGRAGQAQGHGSAAIAKIETAVLAVELAREQENGEAGPFAKGIAGNERDFLAVALDGGGLGKFDGDHITAGHAGCAVAPPASRCGAGNRWDS